MFREMKINVETKINSDMRTEQNRTFIRH